MKILTRLKITWEILKAAFTHPNCETIIQWNDETGDVWSYWVTNNEKYMSTNNQKEKHHKNEGQKTLH